MTEPGPPRSASRKDIGLAPLAVPPAVTAVLRAPGSPLDSTSRAFMEPRFGHDFANVRIHTDAGAAASSRAIGALAYTVGRDIVFGTGQFVPSSVDGRRLIAHELAHVVQQGTGRQLAGWDGLNQSTLPAGTTAAAAPIVQRKRDPDAAGAPAVMATTAAEGGCTFELVLPVSGKDVKFCFVATLTSSPATTYHMSATAVNPEDDPVQYSVDVTVTMEANRVVVQTMVIQMTGKMPEGKFRTIKVPRIALQNAWNNAIAAATPAAQAWDFVVFQVYDESKKVPPVYLVYWMGGEWGAPPPEERGKRVATFSVGRKEIEAYGGPKFFENRTGVSPEALLQKDVAKLIEGREPLGTSTGGFDENTYVGANLKNRRFDVKAPGGSANVAFEEAGGRQRAEGTAVWISTDIPDALKAIEAHFKEEESAIPQGLMSGSFATVKDQVRRLLFYLQDIPNVDIEIHAYTDTVGTEAANKKLSQDRADSVKKYLTDASFWTGVDGVPAALDAGRIPVANGEGQKAAEEALKKAHPTDWKQKLGTENPAFRKIEITYVVR